MMFLDDLNSKTQPGPVPVEIANEGDNEVIVRPRFTVRDVAERLPAKPRRRLLDLRQQHDDAFAAYRATSDRVRALSEERQDAERRLRRIRDPEQNAGRRTPEDSVPVRELTKQIANLASELVRLREVAEVRGARSNQAGALVRNIEDFLKNLGDSVRIMPAPAVTAKPAKGEDLAAAVERRRARLRELSADAHRIKSAPLPSADAKRLAREQIEALSERGAINASGLVEGGKPLCFPQAYTTIVTEGSAGKAVGTLWHTDVDGVLAWLFRDQLVVKIEAEIDAVSDDAHALSTEARAAKLAEIEGDKLICAREEDELIRRAENNGLTIMRRADASPLAVLGIEVLKGE